MKRHWRALAPLVGVAVAGGLLAAGPATAQTPAPSTVTLVHAIIGTPVDVYIGGNLVTSATATPAPVTADAPFQPTGFLPLGAVPPGDVAVQVFADEAGTTAPATAAARTDTAVITQTLTVPSGLNLSVVAQVKPATPPATTAAPVLTPFVNDLSLAPSDQARVSVRHNANAPAVDVYANGARIVSALTSGSKSDLLVTAGTAQVSVFAAGASPASATPIIAPTPIDLQAGRLEALYVGADLAGASPTAFTRDPSIPSTVTLVHGIPGVPVDVYAGPAGPTSNPPLLTGGFQPLTTFPVPGGLVGSFDVRVYPAVATPAPLANDRVDTAVISVPALAVPANQRLSLVAHFQDDDDDPTTAPVALLTPYVNDVSFAGVGDARLSVRHTADFGPVDVYAGGTATANRIVENLTNPESVDLVLPAATLPAGAVTVVPTGEDPALPATPKITNPTALTLAPNALTAVYAVGSPTDGTPPLGTLQLFVRSVPFPNLFNPAGPVRIADTRNGTGGVTVAKLNPTDPPLRISVNGANGVPNTGASAVSLNVTAANTTAAGFLTVFPCTPAAPGTSNVNYVAGQAGEPNAVISGLSAEGDFCVSTFAETDVVVDLTGWLATDSGFTAITPDRVGDTRDGVGGVARTPLVPGQVLRVPVTASANVPDTGVGAVALNVTAANTTADGYLTVYPCTATAPYASNVNFVAGEQGSPNAVIGALSASGEVCVTTFATTDVFVDVAGWFAADSAFAGVVPTRVGDTRDGTGGVTRAPLQPGQRLEVQVLGQAGVPLTGANAVALNVTAANTTAAGFLTVFPCGIPTPTSSNVNFVADQAGAPNAVITGTSADGKVCVTTFATTDVIVDVTGFFAGTIPTA